jgi:hypothetical protein
MDRRGFLKVGAAAGVGAVGSGCVSDFTQAASANVPAFDTSSPEQMKAFLDTLDASTARIEERASLPRLLPKGVVNRFDPDDFSDAKHDRLFRKVMRTLVTSSSFRSLSLEDQAHPGVQSRMWASMGEMDEAVRGTSEMLGSLTATELDDLREALRDDPELPMRFAEDLDGWADRYGLPFGARAQLRQTAVQTCARLKQSPSLLIGEYTDKCRRTVERSGSNEEILRRTTARVGEDAMAGVQERLFKAHERWKIALGEPQILTDGTPAPPSGQPQPGQPGYTGFEPQKDPSAETLVTAGAVMMGISGALTGLGLALLFAVEFISGAVTLTVAGILLLVGLIVLIVGLARR